MKRAGTPRWVLLGMVLAAGATLGAGAAGAAENYKIGLTAAITGRAGDSYAPFYEGIKSLVTRVNDRGGIHGRPIELVVEDDRGEPQRIAAHAKRFTGTDPVILMVVSSVSAGYKPVMLEAEAAKIPVLFAGGICPTEALPTSRPLIFCSTSFEARFDTEFVLSFVRRQPGERTFKMGFAAQDIPISRIAIVHAEQAARKLGIDTQPVVVVPGATADFTPFATTLKEGGSTGASPWPCGT